MAVNPFNAKFLLGELLMQVLMDNLMAPCHNIGILCVAYLSTFGASRDTCSWFHDKLAQRIEICWDSLCG